MFKDRPIILTTENLSIGYAKKPALRTNINLDLREGTLVCLMGPNGSGKSTLIRTLSGLHKPVEGRVLIENKNISTISAADMAHLLSLVLTDPLNAGQMIARELIEMGRYPYNNWHGRLSEKDEQLINEAIKSTQIEGFVNQKVNTLSDGQLQKVLIAKALVQDTPILILDEPTAHLDLNNRVSIVNLLKELARTYRKSIVMATHELDLALQTADLIWLMGNTGPLHEGIPEDLVLNGRIDEVFELKGFDLKTGVLEKASTGKTVQLSGEGYLYLWTKNALERNGFELTDDAELKVTVENKNQIEWVLTKESEQVWFNSLYDLLNAID